MSAAPPYEDCAGPARKQNDCPLGGDEKPRLKIECIDVSLASNINSYINGATVIEDRHWLYSTVQ